MSMAPEALDQSFSKLTRSERLYLSSFALGFIGVLSLLITRWIDGHFGVITIEQMLLNLGGAETGDDSLVTSFIEQGLVLPTVIVLTATALLATIIKFGPRIKSRLNRGKPGKGDRRKASKSSRRPATPTALFYVAFGLVVVSTSQLASQMSVADSILARASTDSLSSVYVDPMSAVAPEKKMNLITIYLESMETTFGNSKYFTEGLLEPIEAATAGWSQINTLRQGDGLGWTMAGIVGTQCSIPIKANANGMGGAEEETMNEIGSSDDHFLPGAKCLGDVLSKAGYTNHFMGGADSRFANKRQFLSDHGFTEIMDKATWKSFGETAMNTWGLEDARLFHYAEKKVEELRANATGPFNLTMLSVDSHRPGLPSSTCTEPIADQVQRAVKCSMQYVAKFLDSLKASGALEDTVVVIMGDHKFMAPDEMFFKGKPTDGVERTIFNKMWSPNGVSVQATETDQYAILPTVLDLLGFSVSDGRAGIGVSAVGTYPVSGTMYALDAASRSRLVLAPSQDLFDKLWGDPAESQGEPAKEGGEVPAPNDAENVQDVNDGTQPEEGDQSVSAE